MNSLRIILPSLLLASGCRSAGDATTLITSPEAKKSSTIQELNGASDVQWVPSANIPVDLFKRDQPSITEMLIWGAEIVVRADRLYTVNPHRAIASPLEIPGMTSIAALAMKGKSERVALGRDEGGFVLKASGASGWRSLPLPNAV